MNNTLVENSKSFFYKNVVWIVFGALMALTTVYAIVETRWLYLGVLFVPFLTYLSFKNPFAILFGFYTLIIPLDALLLRTGSDETTSLAKYVAILIILALSVKGAIEDKFRKPDPIVIWWILLIAYCILTLLWALEPDLVQNKIRNAVGFLILYLIVVSYRITGKDYEILKWFIVCGGFLTGLLSIYSYQTLLLSGANISRVGLQVGDRVSSQLNSLAFCLLIPISVAVQKVLEQKKILMRIILCFVLGVILFSCVLIGSRGAMLSVGVIFVVYFLLSRKKVTFLSVLVPIVILMIFLVPSLFFERWEGTIETGGAGRTVIWHVAVKALEKYWLIGTGLSNFPVAYTEFADQVPGFVGLGRAAHNIYLGKFVELGIIGFALMIVVFTIHYMSIQPRMNSKRYNYDLLMMKASFWAILTQSFFLDSFFDKPFWLLWMLILIRKNAPG